MTDNALANGRLPRANGTGGQGRIPFKSKKRIATAGHGSDAERGERSGHRRRSSGRSRSNGSASPHLVVPEAHHDGGASGTEDDRSAEEDAGAEESDHLDADADMVDSDSHEKRERGWRELVKAREDERKKAIAEGKMDDPKVPKRLEEAITMVGTCQDMCPRFERYRRERENNLDKWEVLPGTKRVDHGRAVKIYERAAGDKTLPSDLRPPAVLKKTLDYLFHDLIERGGFSQTYEFIRDRSRAVRNDFTMQHERGAIAIECHDRCARFHILAIHLERDNPAFSLQMEEQQLANTLQSLKEFYEDQRGKYQAPTELEMRVYGRLLHIRNQVERGEVIPEEITSNPIFQYTTDFRKRVQAVSVPITKTSPLVADSEAMKIFAKLDAVLTQQGNTVMIYLVACILERHFGPMAILNIEGLRGDLTIPEIIDGVSRPARVRAAPGLSVSSPSASVSNAQAISSESFTSNTPAFGAYTGDTLKPIASTSKVNPSGSMRFASAEDARAWSRSAVIPSWSESPAQNIPSSDTGGVSMPISTPTPAKSAFSNILSTSNAFNATSSVTPPATSAPAKSAFATLASTPNAFGISFATSSSGSVISNDTPKSAFAPPAVPPPLQPSVAISSSQSAPSTLSGSIVTTTAEYSLQPSRSAVFQSTSATATTAITATPAAAVTEPKSLNPAAPSFQHTRALPYPVKATPPPSSAPSPPVFPSASIETTPARSGPAVPPYPFKFPQPSAYAAPSGVFSTSASFIPPPAWSTPTQETQAEGSVTPRIVERRQTLWDIPSSVSPQSRVETPAEPISTPAERPLTVQRPELTPLAPPMLEKIQPVALPPTPTSRWFDSGSQRPSFLQGRKKSLQSFPTLQMPGTPSSAEILSPLQLNTPVTSKSFFSVTAESSTSQEPSTPSTSRVRATYLEGTVGESQMNGEVRPSPISKAAGEELKQKASLFRCRLLKRSLRRWKEKANDRLEAMGAFERSEIYKAKLHRERLSSSYSTGSIASRSNHEPNKRRRVSSIEPGRSRRPTGRIEGIHLWPFTDKDLAKRFKETQEEHERRWARGSFLRSIRQHVTVSSPGGQPSSEWRLWLSMNPVHDGTAIWLEHKFDVPASGTWDSEKTFSIPAIPNAHRSISRGSPGLIVFECTPLNDLQDDLEKKYRVLDDCSRLRDIIKNLPAAEHLRFTPTLVVLQWSAEKENEAAQDFVNMAKKKVNQGVLRDVSTFMIPSTTTDLDSKFQEYLGTVQFDLNDRHSVTIGWRDLVNNFTVPYAAAVADWLESCWVNQKLDGARYGEVVRIVKELQEEVARSILKVVGRASDNMAPASTDFDSAAALGKDQMLGPFLDQVMEEPVNIAEHTAGIHSTSRFLLPKARLEDAVEQLESILECRRESLFAVLAPPPPAPSPPVRQPSPGKRAAEEDDISERLMASISRKRMRADSFPGIDESVSAENAAFLSSPSPASTSSVGGSEKPRVTAAMLRSLARDVLKTHGGKRT
ncbi:uncharacterized protein LAESUDRAFT_729568 [Laetiporus sulphureus 93-53]|uniref:SAC3/GANP/THP3 conserved domain-containing protein n=1 Tax=Laetiporus sulphureus 93-53 TaxID=1314785 RepID=A0A165CM70_9APHY|nr:uncharacterized protein LAESUDRAFT_729568 [Laetiporus sulphureus 93-53]KZT03060.1 hypothetical protein LAESUDRAFT_729568 [Laetiporus sulphureus 93-53]